MLGQNVVKGNFICINNFNLFHAKRKWGGAKEAPPQIPKLVKEGDIACLPKEA